MLRVAGDEQVVGRERAGAARRVQFLLDGDITIACRDRRGHSFPLGGIGGRRAGRGRGSDQDERVNHRPTPQKKNSAPPRKVTFSTMISMSATPLPSRSARTWASPSIT